MPPRNKSCRKFYDGMPIQRADGFVMQTGKPAAAAKAAEKKRDDTVEGFVDPKTGEVCTVVVNIDTKVI